MRLHALLSWYDEPIETLIASLTSLQLAGVDHVVALDGGYRLYPDATAASHPNQHAAIALACRELGVACTIHTPTNVWEGNEVEKRTALFALGWSVAAEGDWFMVHDADMVVTRAPSDLKARLSATDRLAGEVDILDVVAQRAKQPDWPERFTFRGLYRAQAITVGPAHCIYTGADGRLLWGETVEQGPVEALDMTADVLIEHRPDERPTVRQLAKLRYYANRDEARIERGVCKWCDKPAVRLSAVRWRWSDALGSAVAEWKEACATHADEADSVGRAELRIMGLDPDSVAVENRMGRIPVGAR